MAYCFHIKIQGYEIDDDYWESAVCQTPGVRLSGFDAELFYTDSKEWQEVFWWHEGSVQFKASNDFELFVLPKALELARILGAEVRGDEGELYGL